MSCLVIDCCHLSVIYQRAPLLKDATFQVREGEIVGLVGLNGAGKSTLLKAILGLIPQTQGQCWIFNEDYRLASSRRHLAFLPERFYAAPSLTGEDFLKVMFGKNIHKKLEEICHMLDFNPFLLTKKIKTLSKGMLQKLGLLYLFMSQRSLLIADELMSGLDMKTRVSVQSYLQKLRSEGHTILFSTHLLHDLTDVCDRVLLIEEGCVREDL